MSEEFDEEELLSSIFAFKEKCENESAEFLREFDSEVRQRWREKNGVDVGGVDITYEPRKIINDGNEGFAIVCMQALLGCEQFIKYLNLGSETSDENDQKLRDVVKKFALEYCSTEPTETIGITELTEALGLLNTADNTPISMLEKLSGIIGNVCKIETETRFMCSGCDFCHETQNSAEKFLFSPFPRNHYQWTVKDWLRNEFGDYTVGDVRCPSQRCTLSHGRTLLERHILKEPHPKLVVFAVNWLPDEEWLNGGLRILDSFIFKPIPGYQKRYKLNSVIYRMETKSKEVKYKVVTKRSGELFVVDDDIVPTNSYKLEKPFLPYLIFYEDNF